MKDEIKGILENSIYCKYDLYTSEKKKILDYITNLEQENERYKKLFEGKERFSKIMPEGTDFIILSKADYDRQQEDIELNAIKLKSRIDKAIEYINEHIKYECDGTYSGMSFYSYHLYDNFKKEDLLNILTGGDDNE